MIRLDGSQLLASIPRFDRHFLDSSETYTRVGGGGLGGKATGLAYAREILRNTFPSGEFQGISIQVPRLVVITTEVFDAFMRHNRLLEVVAQELPDDRLVHAFLKAEMPSELVGDLRALVAQGSAPLAVRSSSLLEDALFRPFAGVYATKMIPNNQPDADTRFRRLLEAIKFVYASTFSRAARSYRQSVGVGEEKMAVIVQEVVGQRHGERFYPSLSGVARSYNFYPVGSARPSDGVIELALGLGKAIVDGGRAWSYSPAWPASPPPFGSVQQLLKNSQTHFWAVNLGHVTHDPVKETEYMLELGLQDAEVDGSLKFVASTYNRSSDRVVPGTGIPGPRILNFARILRLGDIPLNDLLLRLMRASEAFLEARVEIELAMNLDARHGLPAQLGFLQVRPMVVSDAEVVVEESLLDDARALVSSEHVLGNGVSEGLQDVVYVKPQAFAADKTRVIAEELEAINDSLVAAGTPYLLMGFGRWGSSDPWLGIPVEWGQIAGAKVIVEATLPEMTPDFSQGSHFFHNLTSLQVAYFSVRHLTGRAIRWEWLEGQEAVHETRFVRHVRLPGPLKVMVDGRSGRGVILRHE